MVFLKEHLTGIYNWAPQTHDSVYTGNASRRTFDRYNGDQMLFMINLYASDVQNMTIDEVRRVEELLLNQLPMESRSEFSVFNWLRETARVY